MTLNHKTFDLGVFMKKITMFLILFIFIIGFFSCDDSEVTADNEPGDGSDTDEEVYYDPETDFLWSKRSAVVSVELEPETYCSSLDQGGYDNWEVPTIEQLETLLINVPEDNSGKCSYAVDGRYSKLGDRGMFCSSTSVGGYGCDVPPVLKSPVENDYPVLMNFDYGKRETHRNQHCFTRCVKTNGTDGMLLQKEENKVERAKDLVTDGIYKWSERSPSSIIFKDADTYCKELEESGFTDWRLPNISELRTVIKECSDTEIKGACPVTDYYYYKPISECKECDYSIYGKYSELGEGGRFWSSTVDRSNILEPKIIIDFDTADLVKVYGDEECAYIRCVRNDIGDKRENQACMNLPGSGEWNSVDKITQTWDGTSWVPSETGVFNEESSDKECRFKCKEGFVGHNNTCIEPELVEKWSKRAADRMNWQDAVNYCEDLEESGKSNWRLPLISEMRSLVQNCPKNEIGGDCGLTDHFDRKEDVESCNGCELVNENEYSKFWERGRFWSSKRSSQNEDFVWNLNFYWSSFNVTDKENLLSVRCVRADVGETRSDQKCEGLVENGKWNTAKEIAQTWNGSDWEPSALAVHNEDPTENGCNYICKDGYSFYNNVCSGDDLLERWSDLSENEMNYDDALSYCECLEEKESSNWLLPSISELRALIKKCANTETGGECGLTDECLIGGARFDIDEYYCGEYTYAWECYEDMCDCYCGDESKSPWENCPERDDGRYSEFGDVESLWTASERIDKNQDNWIIKFSDATMFSDLRKNQYHVRCIKKDEN